MRLNQFISSSGFCSRRQAERYITARKVRVNGVIASHVYFVQQGDLVEVDGQLIEHRTEDIYMMLNKPRGIVCTASPTIEHNIIDFISYPQRIFPVGRLDKDTEGLILLTNDGSIVNTLMKKEYNNEKEYIVTVNRKMTATFLDDLAQGVDIYNPRQKEYVRTAPCVVVPVDDYTFRITLAQGLNRQIRRMCRRFQYTVTHLQRIRLTHLHLGTLPVGKWRYLTADEIAILRKTQ